MHPSWQIDDIWRLIRPLFDYQDLCRLAQTCKAFFDITTTDQLWETITHVALFVCCLPPDYDIRPLQPQDLLRLDLYSAKIQTFKLGIDEWKDAIRIPSLFKPSKKNRKLGIPGKVPNKSWADLWEEIAAVRPPSEFLPNLRQVQISHARGEVLLPLVGISGRNLTSIWIKYIQDPGEPSIVGQFLEQLEDTSNLKYIMVRDGYDIILEKLILTLQLKNLTLNPRIRDYYHSSDQLPIRTWILRANSLENLTLGLAHNWYTPEIEEVGKYLPKLKVLWLNLLFFQNGRCIENYAGHSKQLKHRWLCPLASDADRKFSPATFLEGLDNPELQLLNIKFPAGVTGETFSIILHAAKRCCRLECLTELVLAGGGWITTYNTAAPIPAPKLRPADMREAFKTLLPLPHLKTLRLSAAPNFLDVLDLDLYRSITKGLPCLEKLVLGHREFNEKVQHSGTTTYERVPLHHLAAFCSMLPNLVKVIVGTVDCRELNNYPCQEWICLGVKSLNVSYWDRGCFRRRGVFWKLLQLDLMTYFPNAELAQKLDPETPMFH